MMFGRIRNFMKSDVAICIFIYCIFFLIFFRARWAFMVVSGTDETRYFEWLKMFIGLEGPSTAEVVGNYYSTGAPIVWIPAGLIGSLWAKISDLDIERAVWAVTTLYSSLFWGLALFLTERVCAETGLIDREESRFQRFGKALVLLLNVPVLYYAVQRTLMSHTVELVLALAVVLLCLKRRLVWALLAVSLLCLTRYNDTPAILLPLTLIISDPKWKETLLKKKTLNLSIAALFSFVLVYVLWICFVEGYDGYTFFDLLHDFTVNGLISFFFAFDFGAVWLLPVWIFVLLLGAFAFRSLSGISRAAWVWMFSGAFLCVFWQGSGGDFGQRYLIGTYAGALVLGSELVDHFKVSKKRVWILLTLAAFWLTALTAVFKSLPDTGYMNNPHFIRIAVSHWFDPEYYRFQFFHTPAGLIANTLFGVEHPYLRVGAETLPKEGRQLLWFFSSLAVFFVLLFAVTNIRSRKNSSDKILTI